MAEPAIAVVMSCYNASAYLARAIESVLSQTYGDYEFIAVNDGSTDETLDILRTYASRDSRLVVVNKTNTGLADSLNIGMEAARGRWVARMDADDVIAPDRLAEQLSFVEEHQSTVLLGAGCTLVDVGGRRIRDYRYPSKHRLLVAHMALGGAAFPHSSAFFDRETAIGIGGYNTRFVRRQDLDLWLRLSRVGEIASLPKRLVKKREHSAGISNDCVLAITMDLAARVCHFIRARGTPDPSQDADEEVWIGFIDWLTRWMVEDSHIEFQSEWFRIRKEFQASLASGGKLRTALTLGRRLSQSGHARRIIGQKLFGMKHIPQLADEWVGSEVGTPNRCAPA